MNACEKNDSVTMSVKDTTAQHTNTLGSLVETHKKNNGVSLLTAKKKEKRQRKIERVVFAPKS